MELLPIGTVVRLKEATHKIMIISRTPVCVVNGEKGYYDYGACLYPEGQSKPQMLFFNSEDIDEVFYRGYFDDDERKCQELYLKNIENIALKKHKLNAINSVDHNSLA